METQPNRRHRRVVQQVGPEPHATKQSFKNETDINHIMARYKKTGAIDHFTRYSPMYGEISPLDFQTAQNVLLRAQQMFDDLPSNIRAETRDPAGFLAFVQDPANKDRMAALGLRNATAATPAETTPPPADPAPPGGG